MYVDNRSKKESVWTDMLTQIRMIFYIMFLFIFVEMKPAFFAILGSTGSIGNSEILKFNVVKTNTGSGYDAITGVFVVPKRGTYHFTSVVYTHLADDAVVQMNKNTALVVRGYSTGTTHATSHVMNVVLILEKGDHIYVQHRGGASDSILGDLHSSFSGFMISE